MVRALAFQQCGRGTSPGVDAICGLSLFVGSLLCSERFFSGYSGFPLSLKTNISNSNSTRNQVDEEQASGSATSKAVFILFIYYVYFYDKLS